MKHIIVVSEENYPSVYVLGSKEEADIVMGILTEMGYTPDSFTKEDTPLETVDWSLYSYQSKLKDVTFL